MIGFVKNLRDRYRFAWDSGLLIGTGAVTGFFYLLVHVVLGRMMPGVDYAAVVALLGLLSVLGLPAAAMQITIARYIAEHAHQNAVQVWVTIFKRAMRRVSFWACGGLAAWILFSPWLRRLFEAPSIWSIILLGTIAVLMLYRPIIGGALQGSRNFGWLAASNFSSGFFRLLLCALIVWWGGSVDGVMTGVLLATFLSLAIGNIPFRRVVRETTAIPDYDTGPIYRYLWPVLLGQGAVFLLMHGDIMMSKRFLEGEALAVYGKAATLSRTVLFLAQPVALAMFPRAVTSARRAIFFAPFLFALLSSLAAAVLIALVPAVPMRLMYGIDGGAYLDCARLYVWAALPISLVGIVSKYLWARHLTGRTLGLLPLVTGYLMALFAFHETPRQMIACVAAGGWLSIAFLMISMFGGRGKRILQKEARS
ncbi:oligosaccharide flippase family protein [Kiritimatiella glycovorans]|uniref:Polysaccharide biosynthesis protein n=1 Tax=Kiritimatiella glycovorans TaxID=1307763 RepID=A0A0G3ELL7_9BACT|nr:oligosaccharide flippase family protein [Kiritimatiella glycovorans]AKJ65039.1 Polysaccharide biosynthesis protein [Kiritimatiella glycovorans]